MAIGSVGIYQTSIAFIDLGLSCIPDKSATIEHKTLKAPTPTLFQTNARLSCPPTPLVWFTKHIYVAFYLSGIVFLFFSTNNRRLPVFYGKRSLNGNTAFPNHCLYSLTQLIRFTMNMYPIILIGEMHCLTLYLTCKKYVWHTKKATDKGIVHRPILLDPFFYILLDPIFIYYLIPFPYST